MLRPLSINLILSRTYQQLKQKIKQQQLLSQNFLRVVFTRLRCVFTSQCSCFRACCCRCGGTSLLSNGTCARGAPPHMPSHQACNQLRYPTQSRHHHQSHPDDDDEHRHCLHHRPRPAPCRPRPCFLLPPHSRGHLREYQIEKNLEENLKMNVND